MNAETGELRELLGFLALCETLDSTGYLGAILVTDMQGVPQEFRCTHPVKPTSIQKPLYGHTLEPYVGVNLCGIPLIQSIQNKLSLMVVQKEILLGVRTETSYPVVFIRRAGEAIEIKAADGSDAALKRERVDSPTGKFQPIILSTHPDFQEDIPPARETIEKIFQYLDPLEPFERAVKAIEVLGTKDERFQ